jgi:hypothetical protein
MSTAISATILDTILIRLAALFLAGAQGNETAARLAAAQMLAAYNPQSEDELRLAANLISFSFHALEALTQATMPDMPLTRILRLRGSAVSLSRESHKAERRLDQLQQARRDGTHPEPQPEPSPKAEKALDLIAETRQVATVAQQTKQTWTQAYRQRQRDKNLARHHARHHAEIQPKATSPATTDPSLLEAMFHPTTI